ncbi:hypothetical protein Tco_1234439 [Tanacetum coccineum]
MLDYGFNFMNNKIYIDNESTICIVKNPVFHSKTKHIEIRHHFIRDSYEKKLIQVIKIHTDHNVADLLSKSSGPIHLVADETVYKEWEDRMERAATTAYSATPTDSHSIPIISQPSSSKPQKKMSRRKQRKESGPIEPITDEAHEKVLDLEKAKTAQVKEITSLKKRVKQLEKRSKSRPSELRRDADKLSGMDLSGTPEYEKINNE